MNPEIRASFQTNQFYYFLIILSLTTVSQLATMLTIVFGNISGKENLIAASVIAMGFMGAFGIIRIMTKATKRFIVITVLSKDRKSWH